MTDCNLHSKWRRIFFCYALQICSFSCSLVVGMRLVNFEYSEKIYDLFTNYNESMDDIILCSRRSAWTKKFSR